MLTYRFVISDYVTQHYWTETICQEWKVITKNHCHYPIWINIRLSKQVCHRNESTPTIFSLEKWNSKYTRSNWKLLAISNWIHLILLWLYNRLLLSDSWDLYNHILQGSVIGTGQSFDRPIEGIWVIFADSKTQRNTTRREPCAWLLGCIIHNSHKSMGKYVYAQKRVG